MEVSIGVHGGTRAYLRHGVGWSLMMHVWPCDGVKACRLHGCGWSLVGTGESMFMIRMIIMVVIMVMLLAT